MIRPQPRWNGTASPVRVSASALTGGSGGPGFRFHPVMSDCQRAIPQPGRDRLSRDSKSVMNAWSRSPGRTGRGQERFSKPSPMAALCTKRCRSDSGMSARRPSLARTLVRIQRLQVCHPLAARTLQDARLGKFPIQMERLRVERAGKGEDLFLADRSFPEIDGLSWLCAAEIEHLHAGRDGGIAFRGCRHGGFGRPAVCSRGLQRAHPACAPPSATRLRELPHRRSRFRAARVRFAPSRYADASGKPAGRESALRRESLSPPSARAAIRFCRFPGCRAPGRCGSSCHRPDASTRRRYASRWRRGRGAARTGLLQGQHAWVGDRRSARIQ